MACWGKNQQSAGPAEAMSFAEIMDEEYAQRVHNRDMQRHEARLKQKPTVAVPIGSAPKMEEEWQDYSHLLTDGSDGGDQSVSSSSCEASPEKCKVTNENGDCVSDEVIALMLQSQYDHEYNEELRRIERQRNKEAKVKVVLDKFHRNGDIEFLEHSSEDEYADEEDGKRDWDRFETNEKKLDTIPKCGFKVAKDGSGGEKVITKHDEELCGIRNACRVMSFPPEFSTGDGAGFDMKLSNRVYNELKTYSRRGGSLGSQKKNKAQNRRENLTTAEMGVDQRTRLLLYKLINNQILEQINGIISTGKEAVILHANSDPSFNGEDVNGQQITSILLPPHMLPKECAIKIFKTTLNDFKQRDRYIKDDYRFKDRMKKQSTTYVINMWAEKEMLNYRRMQAVGINCPDVVVLKKHVLVMSFIGDNHNAAPKLKDARLSEAELSLAYEEIVQVMHKLYNEAKLIHADLSEYNILWFDGKCWFIDVSQAVEPNHPGALEFLMRDCDNIISFFTKKGLPNIFTKEQLFEHITSLNSEKHNVAMLERIRSKGATVEQATAPNQDDCPDALKPISFPFEAVWEQAKENEERRCIDNAASGLEVLQIQGVEEPKNVTETENATVNTENTAKN